MGETESTVELDELAVEEAAKAICPHEAAWKEYEQRYRDDARVAIQTYLVTSGRRG